MKTIIEQFSSRHTLLNVTHGGKLKGLLEGEENALAAVAANRTRPEFKTLINQ
jgi:hypothetical protein